MWRARWYGRVKIDSLQLTATRYKNAHADQGSSAPYGSKAERSFNRVGSLRKASAIGRHTAQPPWASGPAEILKHGLELLKKDTDTNRRLAVISIDNAVELTIKTYLGLPQRVTSLKIPRSEYQEFAESFPKLLDALEKYATSKLGGINLGEIEWYHRIRNQLYHQGNGLTVERDKVEVYAELANVLFANLFGFRLIEPEEDKAVVLGMFIQAWVNFEKILSAATSISKNDSRMPLRVIDFLARDGYISTAEFEEIKQIGKIRNEVVHGIVEYRKILKPDMVKRLENLTDDLRKRLEYGIVPFEQNKVSRSKRSDR
jgi:uncharacterized protein YutE (UPF0331/DUF86 family)